MQTTPLKTLPPNKVTLVQRNGKNYYVYADPAHYQIFVGTPSQYQRYQQLPPGQQSGQDQLATAQLNNMTAMNWEMWELGGNRWIPNSWKPAGPDFATTSATSC